MSIDDVAAAIREALDKVDSGTASLVAAATLLDEARTLVAQATSGTARPEAAQALAALTEARRLLANVHGNVTGCKSSFTDYLTDIADGAGTPTGDRHPAPNAPLRPRDNRIEQLRDELPPPIPREGTGRKTHGRWFVGNGPTQQLVSGEDDVAELAARYLTTLGADRAAVRAHVEIKLSALVRQRYERTGRTANATLVINNNKVCSGDLSCATLLPRMLPPGCSITVVTPIGRQTYTGDPT